MSKIQGEKKGTGYFFVERLKRRVLESAGCRGYHEDSKADNRGNGRTTVFHKTQALAYRRYVHFIQPTLQFHLVA
jgi:hypothetical protein